MNEENIMDDTTYTFNDNEIDTLLGLLDKEIKAQEKCISEAMELTDNHLITPRLIASFRARLDELNALSNKIGKE